MRLTRPLKVSPGNASTSTSACVPTVTRFTSFSTRFATMRTERMSTIEATGTLGLTVAPGSRKRFPTKPSTGEAMTVFERLIFSSSSRDFACSNCALARSSCASAAWWRASVSS